MNFDKFSPLLGTWATKLKPFIESKECDNIYAQLKEASRDGKVICPVSTETFRAFEKTPYEDLKVVFWAQNPYPWFKNGVMVADGIALSCSHTQILQPSLQLFYEGIEKDIGLNISAYRDPDLSYLCKQGIMMLNTSLTVEENKPGSMVELWLPFMRYLIEEVFNKYNPGLIFVLSGSCSMFLEKYIDPLMHHIIKVEHPSRAAHELRSWDHQNLFTKINKLLKEYYNFEPLWLQEVPF